LQSRKQLVILGILVWQELMHALNVLLDMNVLTQMHSLQLAILDFSQKEAYKLAL
jgi:hypothetical protein